MNYRLKNRVRDLIFLNIFLPVPGLAQLDWSAANIISRNTAAGAIQGNESQHYWMLSTIKSGDNHVPRVRLKTDGSTTTRIGAHTFPIVNDSWFHFLATYGNGALILYNNGVDVGSTEKNDSVNQSNSIRVVIGNQPAGHHGFKCFRLHHHRP